MRRALKIPLPIKEMMLITIEARIAQPKDSICNCCKLKPSIRKVVGAICWLIHATKSNSAPLIKNEIRPKVRMYSGMAITLMTGATIELTTPKIAPITSSVKMSSKMPVPPYGSKCTPGIMAETSQIPRPLSTVLTRKRFMSRLCHD